MTRIQPLPFILTVIFSLFLTACGGGGSSAAPASVPVTEEPPTEPEEPPTEPEPPKTAGLLKPAASDEDLAAAIRQGMAGNRSVASPPALDFSPAPPSAGEDSAPVLPDFSTTNLQEDAVDEADRVKYDGEILYVSDYVEIESEEISSGPQTSSIDFPRPDPRDYRPVINMYRTDPDTATVTGAGRIEYIDDDGYLSLYVRTGDENKQLISVSETYSFPHWGAFTDYSYWQQQLTHVRGWTVDDPAQPDALFRLDIEGALLTSRRIGDTLYVITRFAPVVEGLVTYARTDEEHASNDALLQSAVPADLLPKFTRDELSPQTLVSGADCYIPNADYEGPESLAYSGSIVTVTAIDLANPDNITSLCLNGYASGFYVAQRSLYLTTNAANSKTLIHKIALNEGQPQYRGSGEVHGYIGTSNPSFLMSEVDGDLRVISSMRSSQPLPFPVMPSDDASGEPTTQEVIYGRHQLTILRESDDTNQLERIARLPNEEHPSIIGKPGENIFAARFLGNRAYIVTFRTIDPLYVIDLSDPENPTIEGELEIPGFSTLLQPLGDGLLLGVGSDVAVENSFAYAQGVKVALFDVADAENPIELASEIIGKRGSDSPALQDHHALTLLQGEGEVRFAIPIQTNSTLSGDGNPNFASTYYEWTESALHEFSVNTAARTLTPVGKIVAAVRGGEVTHPSVTLIQSRSFIHNNAVFYSLRNKEEVLSGFWGQ